MPDQPPIPPSDAGDGSAFENIFNQGATEQPTIGSGQQAAQQPTPTAEPTAAGDSGSPQPSGNPEPTSSGQQDGNKAAPTGQQQGQGSPEPVGDDGGQPLQPKDDPERWQYWQSKADKTAAQLEKMQAQIQAYQPIIERLNENPQLAQQMMGAEQGSSTTAPNTAAPTQNIELPERPEKPQKPSDYNRSDALSDPQSDSYKYHEAMSEYQEQLAEYNEQLVEAQTQRQKAQQQAAAQKAQRNQQLRELYNEARYRHGMGETQAMNFINWASNPSYTVEDLISVFQSRQQASNQGAQQAQNVQNRNQRLNTPPPPATQGNQVTHEPEPDIDETDPHQMGDLFTDALAQQIGM